MRYLEKSFPVPYMGKAYREGWERMFGKPEQKQEPLCEYNGAKMRINMINRGLSQHSFSVELIGGDWPCDGDLITLCDGDTPPNSRHFGGRVNKHHDGKTATVIVYVD